MRVLQLSISDYQRNGGTGIAMHRLHLALRKAGVDSKIMCHWKTLDSHNVVKIQRSLPMQIIEKLIKEAVTSQLGLNNLQAISSFNIKNQETCLNADILNLHCIHGFFNYLALPALTETKPAVYTFHDMWAFTGHCAYSYDCDRWKTGCGKCPYPDTSPHIKRDGTRLEWKLKNWAYNRSNLTIVTNSKWLMEQAKQSMFSRLPIHHIPYGIDTDTYQPLDPEQCRLLLGIPPGKKVLLFAAERLNMPRVQKSEDGIPTGKKVPGFGAQRLIMPRKGGDLLLKALQSLPESLKAETVLLLLGSSGEAIAELNGFQTLNLGYLTSERLMAIAYSAADLFLFPTRADTFGLVSIESQACGTPVVSFRVGGVPEHVRPGITGYLAEPEDVEDFRDGIVQLLEDEHLRSYMSQKCREIAVKEYSLELYAQRYIELYRQLLQNGASRTRSDLVS